MTKKPILLGVLALVPLLIIVTGLLPPLRTTRKHHATRIQVVNSLPSITFTLTNGVATSRLPVSKP